jgi:hypothetical protein
MKFINHIIALVVGLILTLGFVVQPAQASHYAYIWLGEFQNCQKVALCRDHLNPPTQLHIDLYDGRLNGETTLQRCNDMGGAHAWRSDYKYVCYDVDY